MAKKKECLTMSTYHVFFTFFLTNTTTNEVSGKSIITFKNLEDEVYLPV